MSEKSFSEAYVSRRVARTNNVRELLVGPRKLEALAVTWRGLPFVRNWVVCGQVGLHVVRLGGHQAS